MDEKLLKTLEFDKILERVSEYAVLASVKERIKKTEPAAIF